MNYSIFFIGLILVTHSAFASVKKSTFDIKDNGEHCQASVEGGHTRLDIFAGGQTLQTHSLMIQDSTVLQRSAVDGLCMLRGSERLYVVSTTTGKLTEIHNPIAIAENNAGTQVAVEYVDQGKRAVWFIDPAGKEAVVPFSNYSLSGLGYAYHQMKFTPDDSQLMIIEGMDFAETLLLISASAAKKVSIQQVPARLANQNQGHLSFIDPHTSIFADDKQTLVITDFNTEQQLNVPPGYRFAGSFDRYVVFLNPDRMLLYQLESQSFGREIALPKGLSDFIRAHALEYLELEPFKQQQLLLKTTGAELYLFQLSNSGFKKLMKNKPCSVSGTYCLQ